MNFFLYLSSTTNFLMPLKYHIAQKYDPINAHDKNWSHFRLNSHISFINLACPQKKNRQL